jgi:hypothetical protein
VKIKRRTGICENLILTKCVGMLTGGKKKPRTRMQQQQQQFEWPTVNSGKGFHPVAA